MARQQLQPAPFVLTSDTLLRLVERIQELEKKLDDKSAEIVGRISALEDAVQGNFDYVVQNAPLVVGDDQLKIRVLFEDDREPGIVTLPIPEGAIEEVEEE